MTSARDLVSVVIPCFNQAGYLGESIAAALAQDHAPVEVLVVDDGSTDETSEVARSFPGLRLLRQENRGLSHARNVGLRAASGEFVVFCDADDRLQPTAISSGVACLRADAEAVLAYGRARLIDARGMPLADQDRDEIVFDGDLYERLLLGNIIFTTGAVLLRRAVFDRIEPFASGIDAAADYELWMRVARRFRTAANDTIVLEYRQHDASMSSNTEMMCEVVTEVLARQRTVVGDDERLQRMVDEGVRTFVDRWRTRNAARDTCRREMAAYAALGVPEAESFAGFEFPPGARVLVAAGSAPLTQEPAVETVRLPVIDGEAKLLASASEGQLDVPWMLPYTLYAFRLHDGVDGRLLAEEVAVARVGDCELQYVPTGRRAPYLRITPNPAPLHNRFGNARLEWSMGAELPGDVRVAVGSFPRDADDVLAHIVRAHAAGATHLVFAGAQSWWFDHYAGLAALLTTTYRCVARGPTMTVYLLSDLSRARSDQRRTHRAREDHTTR